MDLGQPTATVIPTLEGFVLQTLARTTHPLTGRQVHQLSRAGSESGVRKVLNRLAHHGLVHATRSGQAFLYIANRDHITWPAVDILTRLREALIDRMRAEVQSWQLKAVTAALFGSAARGDGSADSDIDVLIIRPQDTDAESEQWLHQLDEFREQVELWTGNRCQVYELDEKGWVTHIRRGEPIVAEWKRDAVVLYGEPISELVTMSSTRGRR